MATTGPVVESTYIEVVRVTRIEPSRNSLCSALRKVYNLPAPTHVDADQMSPIRAADPCIEPMPCVGGEKPCETSAHDGLARVDAKCAQGGSLAGSPLAS